jgi:hypothetical protein
MAVWMLNGTWTGDSRVSGNFFHSALVRKYPPNSHPTTSVHHFLMLSSLVSKHPCFISYAPTPISLATQFLPTAAGATDDLLIGSLRESMHSPGPIHGRRHALHDASTMIALLFPLHGKNAFVFLLSDCRPLLFLGLARDSPHFSFSSPWIGFSFLPLFALLHYTRVALAQAIHHVLQLAEVCTSNHYLLSTRFRVCSRFFRTGGATTRCRILGTGRLYALSQTRRGLLRCWSRLLWWITALRLLLLHGHDLSVLEHDLHHHCGFMLSCWSGLPNH